MVFGNILTKQSLGSKGHEIVQTLREAHTNSVTQKGDSRWGVYINTSTDPDSYVLFKGNDYSSRSLKSDVLSYVPKSSYFLNINLGGVNEVVFDKRTGLPSNSGGFSISNDNEQLDIVINSLGLIDYN